MIHKLIEGVVAWEFYPVINQCCFTSFKTGFVFPQRKFIGSNTRLWVCKALPAHIDTAVIRWIWNRLQRDQRFICLRIVDNKLLFKWIPSLKHSSYFNLPYCTKDLSWFGPAWVPLHPPRIPYMSLHTHQICLYLNLKSMKHKIIKILIMHFRCYFI